MLSRFRIAFALVCLPASVHAQYIINTIAGDGTYGYSGDGGAPTTAELNYPTGIAYSGGKLYIADTSNHCVRVISAGVISTFAGVCGTPGYSGNGAAANAAELNNPSAVAVDPHGDVLIADTYNNVIRIVTPNGIISTFAGNNTAGFTGDGGPATNGELDQPNALAVDSAGNVYVTDPINNLIRKINATQQCTTPTTGTPVCGNFLSTAVGIDATGGSLNHPSGIAVDSAFSLYISDQSHRVQKFANGAISVIAGTGDIGTSGDNGPATSALLNNPVGVSVDSVGNVYIVDANAFRVRLISTTGIITTIAGNGHYGYSGDGGPAVAAYLNFPHNICFDGSGNIYLSDTENNVIRELTFTSPSITSNGVVNAASFLPKLAPGSLATIAGTGLATSTPAAVAAPLPTNLAEATVSVNGRLAPILYASPTQINFQVPWETAAGNAQVSVTVDGVVSNTITVPVTATAPGIFYSSSGAAIAENSNYSVNSSSNAAKEGSFLIAYLTGSGAVTPSVADGAATPSTGLYQIPSNVAVSATIGGQNAPVIFAGLTPGAVSLLQLNITIPTGLAAGSYPMIVTIGGQVSNSATVSITP